MITMSTIVPIPMYMAWFLPYANERRWLVPEPDLAASQATCSRSAWLYPPADGGHLATRQGRAETPPPWPGRFSESTGPQALGLTTVQQFEYSSRCMAVSGLPRTR